MNRYKQWLLSLCWLLVFSVGYLSVGSVTVHASEVDKTIQTVKWINVQPKLYFADLDFNVISDYYVGSWDSSIDSYRFNNQSGSNVGIMYFRNHEESADVDYFPDVFDYYVSFTAYAELNAMNSSDVSKFTFDASNMILEHIDCSEPYHNVKLTDVNSYHFDNKTNIGFTVIGKIPPSDSTSIQTFKLIDYETGTIPSNIIVKASLIRVPKSSGDISSSLVSLLEKIDKNTDGIESALNQLEKTIKEQYSINEDEDFGIGDIKDEVESKMGVLSFGSETLVSFLDLFSAESVGSTELTFPGFSIHLASERVTYQVWPDYKFDLAEIEERFPLLINSVRTITVLCVWLAVLSYIVKRKDHFINK